MDAADRLRAAEWQGLLRHLLLSQKPGCPLSIDVPLPMKGNFKDSLRKSSSFL